MLRQIHSQGANPPISRIDVVVYVLILLLGTLLFLSYPRFADFVNDAIYPDLARSILEHRSYEFDFLPETTLPPGLPLILALVGWLAGFSPVTLFHVMAVCSTLGLLTAYELLRRVEGRAIAAAACLVFGSAAAFFRFNTQVVFSDTPFFFVSMLTLLLVLKIDSAKPGRSRPGWLLLLSLTLVLSVLIRSIGITLLGGLLAWIIVTRLATPQLSRTRKWFLIPVMAGLLAQLAWAQWARHRQTAEWDIGGWPQSYLAQLKVKNGNDPELGMAQLKDLPGRIGENLVERTAILGQILTGWRVSRFWSSPAIFGVVVLIAIGLAGSLRNGGQVHDWYFLCQESIYLLWPWVTEERFLFPVVPLACLYLWRGARAVRTYYVRDPGRTGLCFVLLGAVLGVASAGSAFSIFQSTPFAMARMDHVQPVAATIFWIAMVVLGAYSARTRFLPKAAWSPARWGLRGAAMLALAAVAGTGLKQQLLISRQNIHFNVTEQSFYPDIATAEWIRTHEPPERVIMARKNDLLFHYSHHRVVWFPPISSPEVLMGGIERHHVDVVVAARHSFNYWLPPEEVCLDQLLEVYGQHFHLVHEMPNAWIFEVDHRPTT